MQQKDFIQCRLLTLYRRALILLMVVLVGSVAWAQSPKQIKGKVVDEKTGETLIGATVRVVGTTTGTTTNANGEFVLSLPTGKTKLLVSYIGYKEQSVDGKNGILIKLSSDSQTLGEVVVTGMVATDKRLFTGATDRLKADKIKLDGVPDVSRGLEGRSAGVSVQNVSGSFGAAPKVRVRGATSILGNSKPLWVVDGVIQDDVVEIGPDALSSGDATTLISSAIAGLNADDIESFQVLKDGSATSIYGAKAMAGVIVITTKKGVKGSTNISYTGEFTSRFIPSYSNFNIMNSQEQMSVYAEMADKGWLNFKDLLRSSKSGVFGRMYSLINTYDATRGVFRLANTEEARTAYLREAEYRNTDWFKELFSSSLMQNHSVSLSTGTDRSQTYISVSALLDPGWMRQSEVKRYTGNFNYTADLTKKISITTIGGFALRQQRAPGTLSGAPDPVNGTVSRDFDINPYSYAINTSRTLDPNEYYQSNYAPFNIKHELDNNYIDLSVLDLKLQTELKWRPVRGLTLSALGAVKYGSSSTISNVTENSNRALAYRAMETTVIQDNNQFLYTDPNVPNSRPITILPSGGFRNKDTYSLLSYDFRASASYNTEFEGGHILNTYAGLEFNSINRSSDSYEGWGMQFSSGETPFWDYRAFKNMVEQNQQYYSISNTLSRTNAYFATATYSYKRRYTVTGTARYEGSNRLGKSRSARWLPTWNIAFAWNAHEEDFFKKHLSSVLSNLTLKTSYSLTADAGPSWVRNSTAIINSYVPWRPVASNSETANQIDSPENADLTYEKKHELNFGVDMGFLDGRINLAVDYYQRNNFDLIGSINTIKGNRYGNVASMESNGFEVSLSTTNIKTKDFSWATDFIFGYSRNEITSLKTRSNLFNFIRGAGYAREGYPVRALFSIPFTGLDELGMPTYIGSDNQSITRANYGDLNLQEQQKLSFLKYEGPTDPTMTGSLGNIFTWKNFRLNVFITYSAGNKLRLDPAFSNSYTDLTAHPREFNNRWVNSGDEARTDIPVLLPSIDKFQTTSSALGYNVYNYSSARVADGGFIRMKEISLTYTLPQSLLKGKVLKSASVKLQLTNPFLIYADSKLRGQDPEFFNTGGVAAPVPKQFTATLRLGI